MNDCTFAYYADFYLKKKKKKWKVCHVSKSFLNWSLRRDLLFIIQENSQNNKFTGAFIPASLLSPLEEFKNK